MLDKDNQHLFLEDEETDGGSFIANVNKIADNLIPLQELNDKLTPEEINNLSNLVDNVNEVGGNLPVVAAGSTEARKLSDRFSDIINVKDFGAKGDGITDDTKAIQAAEQRAKELGCKVFYPAGTYLRTDHHKPNQQIAVGDGETLYRGVRYSHAPADAFDFEFLPSYIVGFGYQRFSYDPLKSTSTMLMSTNGTSFLRVSSFDYHNRNQDAWGYEPSFINGKLYLGFAKGNTLKSYYYITKDLKNLGEPIEFNSQEVYPGTSRSGPRFFYDNATDTCYVFISVGTGVKLPSPDGEKEQTIVYWATGNPDTNTWSPLSQLVLPDIQAIFDSTIAKIDGKYYFTCQDHETLTAKIYVSETSPVSGYSLLHEFDFGEIHESPSLIKYNGKFILYALGYARGNFLCSVSDDGVTWSQGNSLYFDRFIDADSTMRDSQRATNLRFFRPIVVDTDEKKRLFSNYLKWKGGYNPIGQRQQYGNILPYGSAVELLGSEVSLCPTAGTIFTKWTSGTTTITDIDLSLLHRGDKFWIYIDTGAGEAGIRIPNELHNVVKWKRFENVSLQNDLLFRVLDPSTSPIIEFECIWGLDWEKQVVVRGQADTTVTVKTEAPDLNQFLLTGVWNFSRAQSEAGSNFPTTTAGVLLSFGKAWQIWLPSYTNAPRYYRARVGGAWGSWVTNNTATGHFKPSQDATYDLGASAVRWNNIYASSSAINTSDAREKTKLTEPNEPLMKAWGKVNFKAFQFIDAVEKKGSEEARVHFGVIAQQVQEAFASEGLDASKYALFCYDKWDDEYEDVEVIDTEAAYDEDGNELTPQVSHIEKKLVTPAGDRYGIRYSEALALEAAYQRWLGEQRDKEIAELKAMLTNSKPTGYTLS